MIIRKKNLPEVETMIRDVHREIPGEINVVCGDGPRTGNAVSKSPHTVWCGWNISREAREKRNGHQAAVL
jgi:hypothetical protein